MDKTTARGRGAAAILAGLAVLTAGAGLTAAPAQSVVVAGDCAEAYPVEELKTELARTDYNLPVTTKSVTSGTVPTEFTGKAVGVLDGGVAPNIDMIMVDLSAPEGAPRTEVDEKGIWAGMSGSPVYAEDGRLLGAIAYGLVWGDEPVAGVTPYEEMDDYMATPAAVTRTVDVSAREAQAIAEETDVTNEEASKGFRRLPMPLAYSGMHERNFTEVKENAPKWFHTRGVRAGGAATDTTAADAGDLVAGGNLGAAIAYGDVTFGGIGTVTSVCNDRVIGFGHPMTWQGRTTMGMMPAQAIRVMKDVFVSFKLANMGVPVGTIDQDRLTGISGPLGEDMVPEQNDISSTVTYQGSDGAAPRTRELLSHAMVKSYNADVTFMQLLQAHDTAIDSIQPGSELASFTITGADAEDVPFAIDFGDRYTSQWDIAFEGTWDVADVVWSLSRMDGVRVDEVTTDAHVTDETDVLRIRRVKQRRGGRWFGVSERRPVVARPGTTVRLRAVLRGGGEVVQVPLRVEVPRRARRGVSLAVTGGASTWNSAVWRAKSVSALEAAVEQGVRNDEVQAVLRIHRRGRDRRVTEVSRPQDLVVRGSKWFEVLVRR